MKNLTIVLALTVLCGCATKRNAPTAERNASAGQMTVFAQEDRHALELGRKVLEVKNALQNPEKEESIDAVRGLGLDTRYYVMVRGWILQHISMTESYRGVSTYDTSEQYKKDVEDRIEALRKMLRAIDLE